MSHALRVMQKTGVDRKVITTLDLPCCTYRFASKSSWGSLRHELAARASS
jgi:hypothetical protein